MQAGKARYIGASSMYAWQFAKALHASELHGWTRFVTMQDHYNLLYREEEREMLPLCADQGVGVIPWSPLARGRLTREWDESTERSRTDEFGKLLYQESDRTIVEIVGDVAGRRGVSRAQVALAWMLGKTLVVVAPIVGVTRLRPARRGGGGGESPPEPRRGRAAGEGLRTARCGRALNATTTARGPTG